MDLSLYDDVHKLFTFYNDIYFQKKLETTTVEWSDRMTLCAGICYLRRQGTARYCVIRLSRPLLQYRAPTDLLSTLLHEMIHAYLWTTTGYLYRDGHGTAFLQFAARISKAEIGRGLAVNITIYHTFHDEVDAQRKHVWRCTGTCKDQPPYYGFVKRAINRPPQPADRWWSDHKQSCGGEFEKIEAPEQQKKDRVKSIKEWDAKQLDIETYFKRLESKSKFVREDREIESLKCPVCEYHIFQDIALLNVHLDSCLFDNGKLKVCPVCEKYRTKSLDRLNVHVEICLGDEKEVIDLT